MESTCDPNRYCFKRARILLRILNWEPGFNWNLWCHRIPLSGGCFALHIRSSHDDSARCSSQPPPDHRSFQYYQVSFQACPAPSKWSQLGVYNIWRPLVAGGSFGRNFVHLFASSVVLALGVVCTEICTTAKKCSEVLPLGHQSK